MSEAPRQNKRYPLEQALDVRCESWGEFVQLYATDVSQGGMFIACDAPPELFSKIEVQITLPEGHHVTLGGKIVHVVTAEMAAQTGGKPGVGVQFEALDENLKREIHHLVEFARWEGADPAAKSTYASHMFEHSESRSLRDTAESIPITPSVRAAAAAAHEERLAKKREGRASTPTGPQSARRKRRPDGATSHGKLDAAAARKSGAPAATEAEAVAPAQPKFTPVNRDVIKEAMTHIARKRFDEGIKMLQSAVDASGPDPEALKWLYLAQARDAAERGKEADAASAYRRLLELDETNHEARSYVRTHGKSKLDNIPFGRFFKK